jgi:hypothetical protein
MIELSQPAQCLFCPQRRKIALIMKIALAFSAALIVGVLLFLRAWQRESGASPAVVRNGERAASTAPNQSAAWLADADAMETRMPTTRGRERLQRLRRQGNEVQAELNGILKNGSADLDRSRRLLGGRLNELLLQKVLLLGEYAGNPEEGRAAERKQVLSAVDRELELLEEQLALLNRTAARHSTNRP